MIKADFVSACFMLKIPVYNKKELISAPFRYNLSLDNFGKFFNNICT